MVLQRWDPFGELLRMEGRMNRLWRDFGRRLGTEVSEAEGWAIPTDVVDEGERILVHASIPGVSPDNIQVTIEDGVLTIEGGSKSEGEVRGESYLMRERSVGSFHRALRLPDSVDADKAESLYENGVLTVRLPKVEAKKAKRLEVKVGKAIEGKKA